MGPTTIPHLQSTGAYTYRKKPVSIGRLLHEKVVVESKTKFSKEAGGRPLNPGCEEGLGLRLGRQGGMLKGERSAEGGACQDPASGEAQEAPAGGTFGGKLRFRLRGEETAKKLASFKPQPWRTEPP